MDKNYLIFEDPKEVPTDLNKILEQTISYEVKMNGKDYDLYRLNPPENLLISRGKIEKNLSDCEQNRSNLSDIRYLQSICKNYVFLVKKELVGVLPKNNEYVNNFIKTLDNIEQDDFYDKFYETFIKLVKNVDNITYKENININLLYFITKNILNIETLSEKNNLFRTLDSIIICKLIIDINNFKINLTNSLFKILHIFYNTESINIIKKNEYNDIQTKIDEILLDNDDKQKIDSNKIDTNSQKSLYYKDYVREYDTCSGTFKNIISKYVKLNNEYLHDIYYQGGLLKGILNAYLVYGLQLIYKKNMYNDTFVKYNEFYTICCFYPSSETNINNTCLYYEKNNEIFVDLYFQYCNNSKICLNLTNEYNSILANFINNKYFHITYSFDPKLTYINFTFENDVNKPTENIEQSSKQKENPNSGSQKPSVSEIVNAPTEEIIAEIEKRGTNKYKNTVGYRINDKIWDPKEKKWFESPTNWMKNVNKRQPKSNTTPKSTTKAESKSTFNATPKVASKATPTSNTMSTAKLTPNEKKEFKELIQENKDKNIDTIKESIENIKDDFDQKSPKYNNDTLKIANDLIKAIVKIEPRVMIGKNLHPLYYIINTYLKKKVNKFSNNNINKIAQNAQVLNALNASINLLNAMSKKSGGNKRAKRVNRTQWKVKASYTSPQ